jgi:hypothetical protein
MRGCVAPELAERMGHTQHIGTAVVVQPVGAFDPDPDDGRRSSTQFEWAAGITVAS